MLVEASMTLTKYVLAVSIQDQASDGNIAEVEGTVQRSPSILRILDVQICPNSTAFSDVEDAA